MERSKIDIYDFENYEYKSPEHCYSFNCLNIAEYWILENAYGICKNCMKKLEKTHKSG